MDVVGVGKLLQRNECAVGQRLPRREIMPGMLPRLVAHRAVGHEVVAAQLVAAQIDGGIGLLEGRQAGPPGIGKSSRRKGESCRDHPKIRRNEHQIDGRALADGQLAGARHAVEQLPRGADVDVRFAEIFERRHGQRGENAEDGNHHQQFDEREGGANKG